MKKYSFLLILWSFNFSLNAQDLNFDVYQVKIKIEKGSAIHFDKAVNISSHKGYDNQPMFSKDEHHIMFTSMTKDSTTDLQFYNIENKKKEKVIATPKTSEYSPTPIPNSTKIAFVRVEEDGKTQRVWQQEYPKGESTLLLDKVDSVGYFWFTQKNQMAAFILSKNENAHELRLIDMLTQKETFIDDSIGRCIRLAEDSSAIYYVKKGKEGKNWIMRYNFHNHSIFPVVETLDGVEDFLFYNNVKIWMAKNNELFEYWMAAKFPHWDKKDAFSINNSDLKNITRITLSEDKSFLLLVAEDNK